MPSSQSIEPPAAYAVAPPHAAGAAVDRPAESCVTCGAPSSTPFCARCGERRAADRPRALGAIVEEAWDAFSPVDGRLGRTVASLVRRPGELAAEYMRGVRLPYVPPLRLFLLVNVLFFLHASMSWETRVRLPGVGPMTVSVGGNRTFDTPLAVHVSQTAHQKLARAMVLRRVPIRPGETAAAYNGRLTREYAPRFDRNSTTQAKSLVIAMVPMFALLVAALERRRRRPALQHLVFSLHAMAVMLVVISVTRYIVGIPIAVLHNAAGRTWSASTLDLMASLPMLAALALWLRAGLRRAYDDGPLAATLKALALAAGFGLVLFAYRALLFVTTVLTT